MDWIKLAQNRSCLWVFWIRYCTFGFYKYRFKFLTACRLLNSLKGNLLHATTSGLFLGWWSGGGLILHIYADHFPVFVTNLHLAACEIGTGHSGSILGV